MIFGLALLFAKVAADIAALLGSTTSLSVLVEIGSLQEALIYVTVAALLANVASVLPRAPRRGLLFLGTAMGLAFSLADAATFRYLKRDFMHSAGDLASLHVGMHKALVGGFQYVPLAAIVCALVMHAWIANWSWKLEIAAPRRVLALATIALIECLGMFRANIATAALQHLGAGIVDRGDGRGNTYSFAYRALAATVHKKPVAIRSMLDRPETVVLFINESLPRHAKDSKGDKGALMSGILSKVGAQAGPWIEFPFARTNSCATDISVPSMLTGTDPTEGGDKLEAMPFVFDLAHAAGYRTSFFTPQDYTWAHMNDFFRPAAIDTYVTGDRLGLAYVNDLAVDDAEIADLVAKQVQGLKPHEKAFIVVNTNAFHLPMQSEGRMAAPSSITGRQERTAFIIERVYGQIFSSLENAGRLGNALIIVTSDHGEADSDRPRDVTRLLSHYEEAINVPLFVHLPKDTPPEIERQVRANAGETVENSDIAPTLADFLGYSSPLGYAGFSLVRRVPSDRLTVSVSSCEWKQWSKSAFGMAKGNERFIYVQDSGSRFFDVAKDPMESRAATSGERCDWYLRRAEAIPCTEEILLRNKP
jgi:hypothetical protein